MPQNEVVTLSRPQRELAPQTYTFSEMERFADYIAKSRLFGLATREQALVLMCIAQAEGRSPALAARDYNIIQGKPAKTAEAMQRDFMSAGGRIEWHDLSDDVADATFSHPQGGTIRILWDTARAAKAGLAGKDMWKKFPRQMMRSRCVSEGVRTVYPMATSGIYVPEEVRRHARNGTAGYAIRHHRRASTSSLPLQVKRSRCRANTILRRATRMPRRARHRRVTRSSGRAVTRSSETPAGTIWTSLKPSPKPPTTRSGCRHSHHQNSARMRPPCLNLTLGRRRVHSPPTPANLLPQAMFSLNSITKRALPQRTGVVALRNGGRPLRPADKDLIRHCPTGLRAARSPTPTRSGD